MIVRNTLRRLIYVNKQSPLYKLDPRIKIIWVLLVCVFAIIMSELDSLLVLLLFGVIINLINKTNYKALGLIYASNACLYLSLIIFVSGFTWTGLILVLKIVMKLVVMITAAYPVLISTPSDALVEGLRGLKVPSIICFALYLVYALIPTTFEEYFNIVDAYRLRGYKARAGLLGRIKAFRQMLAMYIRCTIPLTLNVAKRSNTLLASLLLKGFDYEKLSEFKAKDSEYLSITRIDLFFGLISGVVFGIATAIDLKMIEGVLRV